MTLTSLLLLLLAGIVTGTIGAMLGLGGGVFLVPFLALAFGLPMHQAIATSILAIIATSSAGGAMNVERRIVNLRLGMTLETTTVIGAILGGVTANLLGGDVLTKIFAGLLLLVSFMMIWRIRQRGMEEPTHQDGVLAATYRDDSTGTIVSYSVRRVPAVMLVSLVAGNISGLLGVGGGIFKVPSMNIIGGIPMKAATATSNFMIGVTAAASAFIYFAHGHINPLIVAPAALGVLSGSFLGVLLGRKIKSHVLTWVFAIVLLIISIQMFLR
ncbi:MAG: sulfite exporter TauE/SafE family protein [Ignavibacteria bacterium]|nr:sulfite exporter TauE/SafE family protein [Ignavibacteria bacterium]